MIIPVTYYRATMRRGCWKEHRCVGCGTTFRYAFVTEQEALGDRADDALWNAERKVDASLWEDVMMHPCPVCGLYQPDMIGQRQYNLHGGLFVAQLVVLGVMVLILGLAPESSNVRGIAAGAAGLFAAINLWGAVGNRNRNLRRNLARAVRELEAGVLAVESRGDGAPLRQHSAALWMSPARVVGVVLVLAGLAAFMLPVLTPGGALAWHAGAAGLVLMCIAAYVLRRAGYALTHEALPSRRIVVPTTEGAA